MLTIGGLSIFAQRRGGGIDEAAQRWRSRGIFESRYEQFYASANFGCGLETFRRLAHNLSVRTWVLPCSELYLELARTTNGASFIPYVF